MRGIPKPRKGGGLLAWRSRQKRGSIMKSSTFKKIEGSRKARSGKRMAGAAYWRAAKSKYRSAKGG